MAFLILQNLLSLMYLNNLVYPIIKYSIVRYVAGQKYPEGNILGGTFAEKDRNMTE
jgi:hypothetical protein